MSLPAAAYRLAPHRRSSSRGCGQTWQCARESCRCGVCVDVHAGVACLRCMGGYVQQQQRMEADMAVQQGKMQVQGGPVAQGSPQTDGCSLLNGTVLTAAKGPQADLGICPGALHFQGAEGHCSACLPDLLGGHRACTQAGRCCRRTLQCGRPQALCTTVSDTL